MYENGKIRSIETIPGMGGIKDNDRGGEVKYNTFDISYELL
jgi:hypothetical protein